jgi:hypothetical protein
MAEAMSASGTLFSEAILSRSEVQLHAKFPGGRLVPEMRPALLRCILTLGVSVKLGFV